MGYMNEIEKLLAEIKGLARNPQKKAKVLFTSNKKDLRTNVSSRIALKEQVSKEHKASIGGYKQ